LREKGRDPKCCQGGIIRPEDIHAEIGEIILGKKPGRENLDEGDNFDTVGMAIQDIVTLQ